MSFAEQQTQFDSDVRNVESEMPFSFVHNGKTVNAQKVVAPFEMLGMDAGYLEHNIIEVMVRASAYAQAGVQPAQLNDPLHIADEVKENVVNTWTVSKLVLSQDAVEYTLTLTLQK